MRKFLKMRNFLKLMFQNRGIPMAAGLSKSFFARKRAVSASN